MAASVLVSYGGNRPVLVRNSTSFSPKSSADHIRGVMQDMKNSKDSAQFHPDSYWLVFP